MVGRDENVSKMDVDSVDSRPGRRPVENVSGRRRPVGKAQDGRRRRRPVEQLSLGTAAT